MRKKRKIEQDPDTGRWYILEHHWLWGWYPRGYYYKELSGVEAALYRINKNEENRNNKSKKRRGNT